MEEAPRHEAAPMVCGSRDGTAAEAGACRAINQL
jgi:hypothetical protein